MSGQTRELSKPWQAGLGVRDHGRSRVFANCPFCGAPATIYLWSLNGCGKKKCACGAAFYRDGQSRKFVEVPDEQALREYVVGYEKRQRAWPTVRAAAKSLGWTQERVEDTVEGATAGIMQLTAYGTGSDTPLGDQFVEVIQ